MLEPHRFLNLDTSALKIGAEILSLLTKKRHISFPELFAYFHKKYPEDSNIILTAPINLLFLLGKIEYNSDNDIFKYLP